MTTWHCIFPFKHAFIDSTGISPCCNTVKDFGLDVTVDEYLKHPKLLEFQNSFLSGEKPQSCSMCWDQESVHNKSMRLDGRRDYNDILFSETDIDFVHYSQSNICNFKCRSCGPQYSHLIANEINQHRPERKDSISKFLSIRDDNAQWIHDNLSKIKRLLITGGEPTLMPGVREIFKTLSSGNFDIQIMVTTNCSWTDDFWYQAIDSMPNLHITASVDAVGQAAELIRHGTKWSQVEYNLKWLTKHAHSLDVNTVISFLNVGNLYPLLDFCIELQKQSKACNGGRQGDLGLRHQFTIADGYMSIRHFPDDMKPKIIDHLEKCLELNLDSEQNNIVNGLIEKIKNSPFNQKHWDNQVEYHKFLDRIRDEDHTTLF